MAEAILPVKHVDTCMQNTEHNGFDLVRLHFVASTYKYRPLLCDCKCTQVWRQLLSFDFQARTFPLFAVGSVWFRQPSYIFMADQSQCSLVTRAQPESTHVI